MENKQEQQDTVSVSDIIETGLNCLYCDKSTKHRIGYAGKYCTECGLNMFDFDDWYALYTHIKKKHNLERKDVARLLKLTPSTVSTYQNNRITTLIQALLELKKEGKLK